MQSPFGALANRGRAIAGAAARDVPAQANACMGPALMQSDGTVRSRVKPGMTVLVVMKQDQGTGRLTKGVVKDVLTRSPVHPRGIKVRLQSGQIGRVVEIMEGSA